MGSQTKNGFGLVDVIVGTALMLTVFLGIFGAFQLGMKAISQSKNKITATAIANQQIELARNLSYESIGVQGGFPEGSLQAASTTVINNIEYTIENRVDFIVDSADGLSSPEDDCPNDYKKIETKVSWQGQFPGQVELSTDIVPKNLAEECGSQGGILSVSVFDAYGLMVSSPLIEIKNPETGGIIKSATPSSGQHYFSLATSTYKVVISKSGYSVDRTYGTDEVATPEKPHPMVLDGQVVENSFSIDKVSLMAVQARGTKGQGYPPVHGVTFKLEGAKEIGRDEEENPIYKYSQNHLTNGPAEIDISNLEWDSYSFYINSPDYELIELESPLGTTTTQPVGLLPDSVKEVRLILGAENSFLLNIQNVETLEPIFTASTTLSSATYGKTQYTDENGQTYFIPLEPDNYDLNVSASGFLATSTAIPVSGDVAKTVKLRQVE